MPHSLTTQRFLTKATVLGDWKPLMVPRQRQKGWGAWGTRAVGIGAAALSKKKISGLRASLLPFPAVGPVRTHQQTPPAGTSGEAPWSQPRAAEAAAGSPLDAGDPSYKMHPTRPSLPLPLSTPGLVEATHTTYVSSFLTWGNFILFLLSFKKKKLLECKRNTLSVQKIWKV